MISQGVFRVTAMQLLHGAYNLQANHERKEWAEMWSVATLSLYNDRGAARNFTPQTIPCPILTRWWTVGVAATFILEHWDVIGAIAQGVINRENTVKKANQIASGVQSLMLEPVVVSDVHLIAAFHTYFLFPHFAWLQKGDDTVGGTPGFLARHMVSSYFLMHSDLTAGEIGWESLPAFTDFISSLETLSNDETVLQKNKVKQFFKMAREMLEKHFDIWINKHLFLGLFGEAGTAQVVAQFLLQKQASGFSENGVCESSIHDRKISLRSLQTFLET
jgi:hypothetical protein